MKKRKFKHLSLLSLQVFLVIFLFTQLAASLEVNPKSVKPIDPKIMHDLKEQFKTKLYYNKDGGKYYHAKPDCPSVDKKYLPLDQFYYRDLNDSKFKALLPCPYCDAPDRP
jgi:hypothetical protein